MTSPITAALAVDPPQASPGDTITATYSVDVPDAAPTEVGISGSVTVGMTIIPVQASVLLPGEPESIAYSVPTADGLTFQPTDDPAVFTALVPGDAPPPPPPPPDGPQFTLTTLDRATTPQMPALSAGSNDGGASVRQEVWNPSAELTKQVTEVWSPARWQTTINAAQGNTAVNSYPDVSNTVTTVDNTPVPAANYGELASTWQIELNENPNTIAEAAFDIWLGPPTSNYFYELMIWVYNVGQRPAGNDTGMKAVIGPVTYEVWKTADNKTISLVAPNAKQGSTDILAIVQWLIANGFYPGNVGINQIDFGFETPSTGGVDETFQVLDYTLVAAPAAGKVI